MQSKIVKGYKVSLINGLTVFKIDLFSGRYIWFDYSNNKPERIHIVEKDRVYISSRFTDKYIDFINDIMKNYKKGVL